MNSDFAAGSLTAPSEVLVQELSDDEMIFLNPMTEEYFGLDRVGSAMYRALLDGGTFSAAHTLLLTEFEVDADRLRRDLRDLVARLLSHGLLEHHGA